MTITEGASGPPPAAAPVAALSTRARSFHTTQDFPGKTLVTGGPPSSLPNRTSPACRTDLKRTKPTQWPTVR